MSCRIHRAATLRALGATASSPMPKAPKVVSWLGRNSLEAEIFSSHSPERACSRTPAAAARKKARHCGDNCDLLRIMQVLMRSTSGISELQSRNASGAQACCCSKV